MLGFFIFDDLVEIAIVVVVVVVGFLYWLLSGTKGSVIQGNTAGAWTQHPTSINPSPGVGTFVYHVDFTPRNGIMAAYPPPGREIKFSMQVTKGSGRIANITDRGGQHQVDALEASGFTDTNGDITLQVFLEKNLSATLVATDAKTKRADPAISFTADL
jgi:hypothetical protein